MIALLRSLNVLSWPFWVKLSLGFALAVVVPAALVIFVVQSGSNELNTRNIYRYVSETGAYQQQAITSALGRASRQLAEFTENEAFHQQMMLALEEEINGIRSRIVANLFRSNLLTGDLYTLVRLLDADGTIIAQSNTIGMLPPGSSNAEALAYIRAREAFTTGVQTITTVQPSGVVEITTVISRNDTAAGYLIAIVDTESTILNTLRLSGNIYNAYSYLVTSGQNPFVFSQSSVRQKAVESATTSPAVARAFTGSSQTSTYTTGRNAASVIGFYAPIPDPTRPTTARFALVIEVDPAGQALTPFSGSRPFALVVGSVVLLVLLVLLFNQVIVPPMNQLRRAMQAMSQGEFNTPVSALRRHDEIGQLNVAFVDMRDQVKTLVNDLEMRINARMRDIRATHEVSRFAVTQRDLQALLDEVVNLITNNFPSIYHAQIFLLDEDRIYAVLRASTGEAGQKLLQRGHRLAVGSVSVIGQVTQQGQVVVARDTAASQVHRTNEFLPYTRAELAIPLNVAGRMIGALDVQSQQRNAFTEDEITVLQTMADQLAVAIENARLYQDSMRRMADIERANREATRATWQEYVYSQRRRSLTSEAGVATGSDLSGLRQQAVAEGRIIVGEVTAYGTVPVAVPIQLSGQTLGAVEWELPAEQLDRNKLQLAQELANRLAISLDNARLFEDSQRAAERERIVNTIAARLTPQTEINEILQTAVREVGQALRVPQVSIRLQSSKNGKHE